MKSIPVIRIGGHEIGGAVGQFPTLMIGTLFYHGDKAMIDDKRGKFDRTLQLNRLALIQDWSERTGLPCFIDIVGSYHSIINYIDFVANETKDPFLVDCATEESALAALKHIEEQGFLERAIFNSINVYTPSSVLEAIREHGLKTSLILANNPRNPLSRGKIDFVLGMNNGKPGLLNTARTLGVDNILVDTAVLDLPSIGNALRALSPIREQGQVPVGCGAHNGVQHWKRVKKELTREIFQSADAAASAITIATGADFVLYGPAKNAPYVFPLCAMTNAIMGYASREDRVRLPKNHPLYKIY